jgi:endoribonuclease Dicer
MPRDDLGLINETECPVLEFIEVHKVLGDIIEAIMGAIYLDCKGNLGTCWKVFNRIFPGMSNVVHHVLYI